MLKYWPPEKEKNCVISVDLVDHFQSVIEKKKNTATTNGSFSQLPSLKGHRFVQVIPEGSAPETESNNATNSWRTS